MRLRLEGEHGVPRLDLAELIKPALAVRHEQVGESRVVGLGLSSCLDYYQAVSDSFSQKLLAQYDALYPGDAKFTGGGACSGLYRGIRLWAAAVAEAARSVRRT